MSGVKGKSGRKKGFIQPPKTIERIRASINSKLCIDTLHRLAASGSKEDSVKATAALGLLQFTLPRLTATDITSDGDSIVVERVMFKRPTEKGK